MTNVKNTTGSLLDVLNSSLFSTSVSSLTSLTESKKEHDTNEEKIQPEQQQVLSSEWQCEKYESIVKLNTNAICLQPIAARQGQRFYLGTNETYNVDHHQLEQQTYLVEKLNAGQRDIYNYIEKNSNDIIIIQAGPGCGKSFVLKTIAYNQKKYFDTIIYKNDLLASFRYNTRRNSVASFMMKCLNLQYYSYLALDKQLASSMDTYEFMLTIISMLRRASLSDVEGSVFFLDEYTVMTKPFLVIILILFEYYKIGAIICGDRNQLQNIHNSKHTILSSYWMAKSFTKREFILTTNERCGDVTYNSVIQLFAEHSSSNILDEYAFAMVSAFFLRQLMEPVKYDYIHLAATHRELAQSIHMMSCQNGYPVSFYEIDVSRVRDKKKVKNMGGPTLLPIPETTRYLSKIITGDATASFDVVSMNVIDKFLPYLPLVIGATYFVERHSEHSLGTLIEYDEEKELVTMLLHATKLKKTFGKSSMHKDVIFQPHHEFLMQNVTTGQLHNYPIYPSNFMSVHKCQGCTISGKLNLMLNKTTYQGLYVALSRVMDPKQIARVTIKNQLSHLVSTIINFPQYCENRIPTADEVRATMINYIFYDVSGIGPANNSNATFKNLGNLGYDFLCATTIADKMRIRQMIYNLVISYPGCVRRFLAKAPVQKIVDPNLMTMGKVIKYRDIMLSLSCIDEYDRNVWLHEFLINNVDLAPLLPEKFKRNSSEMNTSLREATILTKFAGLHSAYDLNVSSFDYIKSIAKTHIRMTLDDQIANEKYRIEMPQPNIFIETTEFCARVYKKYEKSEICTVDWLMNELNCLLERNQNVENLQLSPDGLATTTTATTATNQSDDDNSNTNEMTAGSRRKLQNNEMSNNFSLIKRKRL